MSSLWLLLLLCHLPLSLAVLAVVGSKCDLQEKQSVADEQGQEFANSIGASFHKTSAKEDSGVDGLFKSLSQRLFDTAPVGGGGGGGQQTQLRLGDRPSFLSRSDRSYKCCT